MCLNHSEFVNISFLSKNMEALWSYIFIFILNGLKQFLHSSTHVPLQNSDTP